jgi:hypothetical protein
MGHFSLHIIVWRSFSQTVWNADKSNVDFAIDSVWYPEPNQGSGEEADRDEADDRCADETLRKRSGDEGGSYADCPPQFKIGVAVERKCCG